MRKARRKGRGCADPDAERIAQRSGTSPNHAKIERHAGSGPANGNGSSSRPADTTAATHNFHCAGCASGEDTARASTCCIQREFIAFAPGDGTGAIESALELKNQCYECALLMFKSRPKPPSPQERKHATIEAWFWPPLRYARLLRCFSSVSQGRPWLCSSVLFKTAKSCSERTKTSSNPVELFPCLFGLTLL